MNLYQASRYYLDKSEHSFKTSLALSFLLLLFAVIALFPLCDVEDTILIIIIAATQLTQMWQKYRALFWFAKGDEPRRMYQFQSGLGLDPSREKCATIEQEIGACSKIDDGTYWLSKKPVGVIRMTEMLLESSFYTRALACKARNLFWVIGSIGLALAMTFLIVALEYHDSSEVSKLISHIVFTVLIFFMTGDFWIAGKLYSDLWLASDEAHKNAFSLLKRGKVSRIEALEAVMSYNTAVVQAPPLLASSHRKSKDALDEVFKRNYSVLLGL